VNVPAAAPDHTAASDRAPRQVYGDRDAEGALEVVDEGGLRTLYFGTPARQSTMFRHRPWALALAYTHCMVLPLVFLPRTHRVLLLGLGGGSLAKFLLRAVPAARLEAVERRALVIAVARAWFGVPDDPRLQVRQARAEDVLQAGGAPVDLLLVDLHDAEGMAPVVAQPLFLAACQARLAPTGILAINLWAGARADLLARTRDRLTAAFGARVLQIPVAGKANTVALAFNGPLPPRAAAATARRAWALHVDLGVPLPPLLDVLAAHNPHWP
jgi:spermidine synthase